MINKIKHYERYLAARKDEEENIDMLQRDMQDAYNSLFFSWEWVEEQKYRYITSVIAKSLEKNFLMWCWNSACFKIELDSFSREK